MLISHIREATKASHAQLEKTLIPALKNISSVSDYKDILYLFYGYFYPLELAINDFIDRNLLPDMPERRKCEWIEHDLQAMGLPVPSQICSNIPLINTPAAAWGALYVLEGSTLGGSVISTMISKRLQQTHFSITFFTGYGNETMDKWSTFLAAMNEHVRSEQDRKEATIVANQTFEDFKTWAEQHLYVGN